MKSASIQELAAAWRATKAAEQQLVARRLEIEQEIVAALPATGQQRTTLELADGARLAIAFGITRKVDADALGTLWSHLPPQARAAFRWKAEVREREFKALLDFAPEEQTKLIASVVETKPAKPAFTLTTKPEAPA
jgi:hypothetical protein